MKFEYDSEKSRANKAKHGIDFEEARALWDDPDRVQIEAHPNPGETRHGLIAILGGRHWSAYYTLRVDGIRIISVRRSRKKEVDFYETRKKDQTQIH